MYYRKTQGGQEIANRCGIGDIYASVGSKIHHDDITSIGVLLDMTNSGMDLLFEIEDGEEDCIQELDFTFGSEGLE